MKTSVQFVEDLVKQIVNSPNDVAVTEQAGRLEIKANSTDLGIIIGKSGKNIRSLKNLLNLKTVREGLPRLEITIHEENQEPANNL